MLGRDNCYVLHLKKCLEAIFPGVPTKLTYTYNNCNTNLYV